MFINKKFVYLRSMVRVAVFTCVYTLAINEHIQANIYGYNNNRLKPFCTHQKYTRFLHVYLIIVFINGLSIVCVQMYTIDVLYCVVCLRLCLCCCFGMC